MYVLYAQIFTLRGNSSVTLTFINKTGSLADLLTLFGKPRDFSQPYSESYLYGITSSEAVYNINNIFKNTDCGVAILIN